MDGLVAGGADIILIETIFDTLNAKAAVFAVKKYFDDHGIELPVMISGTHFIVVQHPQGTEMNPLRIVIICKTKCMITFQPSMIGMSSRSRFMQYCFHIYSVYLFISNRLFLITIQRYYRADGPEI
jgi:hypothetical protein